MIILLIIKKYQVLCNGIEFEAKFLDINKQKIIKKLLSNGGSIVHKEKMYKRTAFYRCNQENGFTRVRDEGDYRTITTKFYKENSNFYYIIKTYS